MRRRCRATDRAVSPMDDPDRLVPEGELSVDDLNAGVAPGQSAMSAIDGGRHDGPADGGWACTNHQDSNRFAESSQSNRWRSYAPIPVVRLCPKTPNAPVSPSSIATAKAANVSLGFRLSPSLPPPTWASPPSLRRARSTSPW